MLREGVTLRKSQGYKIGTNATIRWAREKYEYDIGVYFIWPQGMTRNAALAKVAQAKAAALFLSGGIKRDIVLEGLSRREIKELAESDWVDVDIARLFGTSKEAETFILQMHWKMDTQVTLYNTCSCRTCKAKYSSHDGLTRSQWRARAIRNSVAM